MCMMFDMFRGMDKYMFVCGIACMCVLCCMLSCVFVCVCVRLVCGV